MGKKPEISVLMSVYNGEKYLKACIDSILDQTFKDFEFIIINDASTDQTSKIIQFYTDSRIVIINNDKNLKLGAALNRGVKKARGKYIARMDADDISHPERLKTQYEFMEKNPNIGVCGSWVRTFGRKFKTICRNPVFYEDIKASLLFYNSMAHPSVFIRKELLLKYPYNENFARVQDYNLWAELADKTEFHNIPRVLLDFRLHCEQERKKHISTEITENTLTAKLSLLSSMGVVLSKDEKEMLKKFPENLDSEDSGNVKNFFRKVILENNKTKFCAEKSLYQLICDTWLKIILKAHPENAGLIREFLLFPLPLCSKAKSIYKMILLKYSDIIFHTLRKQQKILKCVSFYCKHRE